MPPSTTPHMPGTSRSTSELMTWQVEVPMIATIWPGPTAWAAGAVTWASTLPTATAMPSGRPVQAAASAVRVPAAVAELADRLVELVGDEPAEAGRQRLEEVRPSGSAPS